VNDVRDDEINLVDIWRVLVAQKKLICTVTLIILLLGSSYAFFTPKVYKAEAYLLPPLAKQIQGVQGIEGIEMIKGIKGIKGVTVKSVYAQFVTNLKSRDMRKQIFQTNNMWKYYPESDEGVNKNGIFEMFNKGLQLTIKKNQEMIILSFELGDAEIAADLVNDFVVMAAKKTVSDLFANVDSQVGNMEKFIQSNIAAKRSLSKQNRLDRINVLREAILIARSLKIVDAEKLQAFVNIQGVEAPLYLTGEKALTAEMKVLQARKNDDPFIGGLRDLQERLALLKGINITLDQDKVFAVRVDQKAFAAKGPIKPKKALIVILSILFGLMLGVLAAFIRNALRDESKLV